MNDKYILAADGKTPIPEPDLTKWAEWFEKSNRKVASDVIGPFRVSTVFLAVDHGFSFPKSHLPILWETMIFGPLDCQRFEDYQGRYTSYEAALEGHEKAVKQVKSYLS